MKPDIKKLITLKRQWDDPLLPGESERGFKHWYAGEHLPHFDSPGAQQFITYRLEDSLPAERRSEWEAMLKIEDEREKRKQLEAYLDRGMGACHLRCHQVANIVQSNLWHHDGVKYRLQAWIIMPNHVHVLLEQWEPLGRIMKALKGYTSREANRLLKRRGTFWAEDYFDRYIRGAEHERAVIRYIEQNPIKVGLSRTAEDWHWSSARYRRKEGPDTGTLTHSTADRTPLPPI